MGFDFSGRAYSINTAGSISPESRLVSMAPLFSGLPEAGPPCDGFGKLLEFSDVASFKSIVTSLIDFFI